MSNSIHSLQTPTSGQVINTVNTLLPHDDYGPQIHLTIWTLTAVAAAWLGVRIYCKCARHRGLWFDDYVLIASWVVLIFGDISLALAVHFGFGKHTYDIPQGNFPNMLLVSSFAGFFMIVGAAWSKTSFAITLLRISSGWVKFLIWFIIVSVNVILGFSALFTWVRCWPLEKNWHPNVDGTCIPFRNIIFYNVFTAGFSGAMDIVLALLPWKMLWNLNMSKKEKLGALCAMSMGVFAGITSLIKTITIPGTGKPDIADTIQLVILAVAEIAVTIIAASIPILRALAKDTTPKTREFLPLSSGLSWSRRRGFWPEFTAPSPTSTEEDQPEPPGLELQPISKKRRNRSRNQIKPLSRIVEAEELPKGRRFSSGGISPV
ncbi:uncharacterized protein BCR38DRAFT_476275 [Pseudomassariella vexata]|uniref:Rhodopsin domain-containing protein n=1 Tax=Pseudomassariella vexata TaxID=1141098 RepID=A0A1Y2DSA8_9PEZI|nr:uncharacterized protein BCR38DRAFT_476275 [Pseudomassariella vexata]ORY61555.1 hypothetical protein BCR38DRAFT_476275 [Pseudomassariella vexata]